MTELDRKKLWEEYKKKGTRELRNTLIEEYAHLVKVVSGKLSLYFGANVEYDDLNSYGVFGLIDAIDKYDIQVNVKFETYATIRIRGAILDNIRKSDWVPRTLRDKQKELEKAKTELLNSGVMVLTDDLVAKKMGITVETLNELEQQLLFTNIVSLDEFLVPNFESKDSKEINIRQNTFETPEEHYDKEELASILKEALNVLTEKEKITIEMIYYEDLTAKEISKILDVSESRISQLHSKALKKLREPMGKYMNVLVNKERIGL